MIVVEKTCIILQSALDVVEPELTNLCVLKKTCYATLENIIITGFVDDLEAFIQDAGVMVAPVRVAAGIQNKVLVAMGCGLPVVMTSLISHAIPELEDGVNCRICDGEEAIAGACLAILADRELRSSIAERGYKMVKTYYSWQEKLSGYEVMPESQRIRP